MTQVQEWRLFEVNGRSSEMTLGTLGNQTDFYILTNSFLNGTSLEQSTDQVWQTTSRCHSLCTSFPLMWCKTWSSLKGPIFYDLFMLWIKHISIINFRFVTGQLKRNFNLNEVCITNNDVKFFHRSVKVVTSNMKYSQMWHCDFSLLCGACWMQLLT